MVNNSKFIKMVQDNPKLPIIPIIEPGMYPEDSNGMCIGHFDDARMGEIASYDRKYFDDRQDFKQTYYKDNKESIDYRFRVDPDITVTSVDATLLCTEDSDTDIYRNGLINTYLDDIADSYFKQAIIVDIVSKPTKEMWL